MSRKITAGLLAGVLVLGLAGCSQDEKSSEAGSERANQMYTWVSNESDREQWETFIAGVQEGGDAEFDLELEGPSFQEYWTLVRTRMSAADAPCIMTTQAARAQELSQLLAPLDELAENAGLDLSMYNEAMMQGLTVDGTVRALPYDAEPMLLYYNKALFEEKGLDLPGASYSRDQFVADAKALTGDGKYGVYVAPDSMYPYLPIAFADGNAPVKDGELAITDPAFVDDFQWVMDLVTVEQVAGAPSAGDNDERGRAEFFAGNVAMIIDGPWFYSTIVDGAEFEVGISVPPSTSGEPVGMIQGSGFGIAESCPDKEAAFDNIMKMTTPDVVGYVGKNRGTVPSVAEAMSAWSEGKPAEDVAVVEALLENALPLETTSTWNQFVTQFAQYSPEGVRGVRTAEEILTSIEQGIG